MSDNWHTVPIGDLREHERSASCWCRPMPDPAQPNAFLHNSMDRREEYERGRKTS